MHLLHHAIACLSTGHVAGAAPPEGLGLQTTERWKWRRKPLKTLKMDSGDGGLPDRGGKVISEKNTTYKKAPIPDLHVALDTAKLTRIMRVLAEASSGASLHFTSTRAS